MVNMLTYPGCELDKLVTRGQSPIRHVEFCPKGRFLAVATDDGVIRYISVQMPSQFTILKGHTDSVRFFEGCRLPTLETPMDLLMPVALHPAQQITAAFLDGLPLLLAFLSGSLRGVRPQR